MVDLEQLQGDQAVYCSDGKKLGDVAGISVDLDTGEEYLEVTGPIFSHKDYYVPRHAIEHAVLGEPVRLNVTCDVAEERFTLKPNVI
ncbi:MAG TPA: hypothetical protein VF221_17070 [Chloroflexota bacterium]